MDRSLCLLVYHIIQLHFPLCFKSHTICDTQNISLPRSSSLLSCFLTSSLTNSSSHTAILSIPHCCSLPHLLNNLLFLFATTLCLSPLASFCRASVFGGLCHRESWELLQPFTQLQCVQHRPGHQRGYHHPAVRRILWAQGWCRAHSLSMGGHQLRSGPAHPNVHSYWPGREDGRTCNHWPKR